MQIAVVRLREAGQVMSYRSAEDVKVNDYVIVEADRGVEYGMVVDVKDKDVPAGENKGGLFKNIVRSVNAEDKAKIERNQKEAKEAMRTCFRKIREYKLEMKLVEAEYSFDRKKIVFYFTSEGRIDFRELVKDLAKVFKRRIEMRQVGVRDEARMFGGVGPCGETLCCVRFLKNFEPVSMKMAKVQKLSLTSGKISGICGRLMCCLSYEYKTYKERIKGLPKEGQMIDTPSGKGKVISVNVLKRLVHAVLEDGRIEKIDYNCLGKTVGCNCKDKPMSADNNKNKDKR